ncbi:gliding motility-associated C-terminal domain-containing protein [bacterium]|nr:gliding motility-associated C-terminal domain-containing protein [bacterium]
MRFLPDYFVIHFVLPKPHKNPKGKLLIFNILSEVVCEFELKKANGFVEWNGTNEMGNPVSSGVYFYKLEAEDFTETKKMVLLK